MGREIERKFLVTGDGWRGLATAAARYEQFYLFAGADRSLRVRIADGRSARLTLKTGRGLSRGEFEYDIPLDDAEALRETALGAVVAKTRHFVPSGGHTIEVDVYEGALAGLVTAEIELEDEAERFDRPDFLGREVTDEPAYLNQTLALAGLPVEAGEPEGR
ncbi:CYTH domain-containing protein [Jiella sonneratiae]|uniref:CYTH domain-containing protein n=1 Tax=Jiella sonneratiae TaxID=2816856 RepID=A0ABS3J0J5_9HYPH|nr:CYTH domain-containing protein [Jiella sonneratiae]MBO0903208.1 CYTH domain-containing protein [Jiella sonneratiae]